MLTSFWLAAQGSRRSGTTIMPATPASAPAPAAPAAPAPAPATSAPAGQK
jgi:hypothetical protein